MKKRNYPGFRAVRKGQRLSYERITATGKFPSRKLLKTWFDRTLFDNATTFHTFVNSSPKNFSFLVSQIKRLAPNPTKMTALEIGPGDYPVLDKVPFKERYFVDVNLETAKKLQAAKLMGAEGILKLLSAVTRATKGKVLIVHDKQHKKENPNIVVADIKRIPFQGRSVDVAVVNEVLTHVMPSERIKAVEEISRVASSIIIVDRKRENWQELLNDVRRRVRKTLSKGKGNKGKKITEARKLAREIVNYNITTAKLHQATTVDFGPIINFLKKNGWQVETIDKGTDAKYTILKAKRKK